MDVSEKTFKANKRSLPQPSTLDLRGRQSVRATFKLSPQAIAALSIVAAHLGIKQKSIFDHLIEDIRSLVVIAQQVDSKSFRDRERIQKTFVISRKTLIYLEKISEEFEAPRDALVEMSIQRLLPIIYREQQRHYTRKKLFKEISYFLDKGAELLAQFETYLGDDDPATAIFQHAIETLSHAQNEIEAFIKKGEIIENFDLEQLNITPGTAHETSENDGNINHSSKTDLRRNLS